MHSNLWLHFCFACRRVASTAVRGWGGSQANRSQRYRQECWVNRLRPELGIDILEDSTRFSNSNSILKTDYETRQRERERPHQRSERYALQQKNYTVQFSLISFAFLSSSRKRRRCQSASENDQSRLRVGFEADPDAQDLVGPQCSLQ